MWQRAVPAIVAAAVALAGLVLARASRFRVLRAAAAATAAYGALALAIAAATGITLSGALAGVGWPHALPRALQGASVGALVVLPIAWIVAIVRAGIPRWRRGSLRHAIYQAVALSLALALVTASLPSSTRRARADSAGSPARVASLANGLRAIEDGERDAPRDLWDPAYIVSHVGRDDRALFAWARGNTLWVPYRGLLRGATGVLMDRLGNSLDRSMLLGTLLRDAGYTVRLAHAELSRDVAARLLPRLVVRPFAAMPAAETPRDVDAPLRNVSARYRFDTDDIRRTVDDSANAMADLGAAIRGRAADQTRRLQDRLQVHDGDPDVGRRIEAAIAALRDHWWVQRQDGPNWIDYDVAADGEAPGAALAPALETPSLDETARSAADQVVVRIVAERLHAGAVSERAILEYTMRTADTIGQPIVLQFWPLDWPPDFRPLGGDPRAAARATILAQRRWEATLVVGANVAERAVVTDSGGVQDSRVTANPFGTSSDAFSTTMGTSSGGPDETLTALWIDYETRLPGGEHHTERRAVFDLLGAAARESGALRLAMTDEEKITRSLSLMMRTEILPVVCRIAPEFFTHLVADSLLQNRALLTSAAAGELDDPAAALSALTAKSTALPSPLYVLAIARFDLNPSQDHVYIDRPTILTRHEYPAWRADGVVVEDATDIVSNQIGVDLLAPDARAIRFEQGVLDTAAERLAHGPGPLLGDTSVAFDASPGWIRIGTAGEADAAGLHVPADARAAIAADVRAGYVVVAAAGPVMLGGRPFVGWWRVDPSDGHVLGVDSRGWGASLTERGFLTNFAWLWAKEFSFQYLLCLSFAEAAGPIDRWWMTGDFHLPDHPGQAAAASAHTCALMSLIASGIFVTLPFFTMYIAARVGAAGGIRAGFTLWLRGIRGRVVPPLPPRLPPYVPGEPPIVEPPCEGEPPSMPPEPGGAEPPGGNADAQPGTGSPHAPDPSGGAEPPNAGKAPALGPQPDRPITPQQFEQYVEWRTANRVSADAQVASAQDAYLTAEKAQEAATTAANTAKSNYVASAADGADRAAQDQAYEAYLAADRQRLAAEAATKQAMQEVSRATKLRDGAQKAEQFAQQLEPVNDQLWEAKQQLDQASSDFASWMKAHPDASSDAYRAEWQKLNEASQQYARALRNYYDALRGKPSACGPGNDNVTVPDAAGSATEPDPRLAAGVAQTVKAIGPK